MPRAHTHTYTHTTKQMASHYIHNANKNYHSCYSIWYHLPLQLTSTLIYLLYIESANNPTSTALLIPLPMSRMQPLYIGLNANFPSRSKNYFLQKLRIVPPSI